MSLPLVPALLLAMQAPVIAVPAPPAPPPRPSPQDEAKLRAVPHRIDVRMSAGRELLWEGPLMVSRRQGANLNFNKNEATQPLCLEEMSSYENNQTGIGIGIRALDDRSMADRYMLDIQWTRRAEPRACGSNGSRRGHVDQSVVLPVGQTLTVQGDAGLVIQLTRRD